ncbi:MAG: 7-carboxy-7-deazaguanine synthase QueE [Gammaproteobacteria bacterium]|nr:7-carboxy-7-deazaguanine synthase QueE [Gammaproteobacteria bacterium]HBJ88381.1 7-carboxy-7-deazaguanine synthase QueE [Gammaproteobacteria bacterium]HCL73961.1 7-carboxy-7-deazaguanine synthase QueE [Gammaproteobacteria bacterium]|tara:strand:+ start:1306 stop:1965 length:660 start_codon:yes stop_codon:yes gene_type:complete
MPVNPAVTLRITEIFHSLQGEASTVGRPTVFIRLTGCPLRCQYCDTAYAFEGGSMRKLEEILAEVERLDCQLITVTGGEPLAQPNCILLLQLLCDEGYQVSLETSGALSVEKVDPRVSIVLDLKTPGSREADRNDLDNLSLISQKDQVKFVICNNQDYVWAKAKLLEWNLAARAGEVLFSPSFGEQNPAELAEWILEDHLPVRMQMQLHKLLWGEAAGR